MTKGVWMTSEGSGSTQLEVLINCTWVKKNINMSEILFHWGGPFGVRLSVISSTYFHFTEMRHCMDNVKLKYGS